MSRKKKEIQESSIEKCPFDVNDIKDGEFIFEPDKFAMLTRCLSVIKDVCNDADIQDGFARQRLNEQFCTAELNLSCLLGNSNLPISGVKSTLDLVKIFSGSAVKLTIKSDSFIFSDNTTSLEFQIPILDYLDNKYINQEDLASTYPITPDDLVLKCQITKNISDRIKVICQGFNINTLQINFSGENASITTRTQATDKEAVILNNIVTNKIIDEACFTKFVSTPFIIDHDGDIDFEVYETGNDICICKASMKIGDIDLVMFSRSSLRLQDLE